ncbi:MAG: hypothetical protein WD490_07110 [Opitutales bacterium]
MINFKPDPTPFRASWKNTIAMGRAYELLRADAREHLSQVQTELGFSYCRFHGLFHDDMAVARRREDGSVGYQWHQVDKVFDFLLGIGLRPFVELNPMPACIASGNDTMFEWKMNITPPAKWKEWGDLVRAFTRHCVDRYGIDEVRRWYFEVWNEPNLGGFWSGGKEDYWELYRHAVLAVREVDAELRVGGPASSKGSWVGELIAFCGAEDLPIDFVSTHFYPQDMHTEGADVREGEEGCGFFIRMVKGVRDEVAASARPDLEIHFTEWNTLYADSPARVSWVDNPSVDDLSGAARVCRICSALDDTVDSLCYWTASDIFEESGLPHSPFSGTYGLIGIHGHPKPNFHAFAFLNRLRGTRWVPEGLADPTGLQGAVAARDGGVFRVLLWNQIQPGENQSWSETLYLPHPGGTPVVVASRIRDQQGSASQTWHDLGLPHNLSPATERLLAFQAQPEVALHPATPDGEQLTLTFTLQPGEVLLLECESAQPPSLPKGRGRHEIDLWDRCMNEKSKA